VEAAREAIRHNRRPANSGRRFWELSGGLLQCADCGYRMATHSGSKQRYSYYRCQNRECPNKGHRAAPLEGRVAEFVRDLLHNPEKLKAHADELMERERRILGNPEQAAKVWKDKLATIVQLRRNYQHQQAAGFMTLEELGKELAELEEDRRIAEQELAAATAGRERMEELKSARSIVLGIHAGLIVGGFELGRPEERYEVYNRLRLRAVVDKDGELEVTGAFDNNFLPNNFEAAYDVVRGLIGDDEGVRYAMGPRIEKALSFLNDVSE
jgi:hypothetical protein